MTKIICLEQHASFASACKRARALAIQQKRETFVRAGAIGWEVFGFPLAKKRAPPSGDAEGEYEFRRDDYVDDDDSEVPLLLKDIASDQDDWGRSQEEGWYYADGGEE